MWIKRLKRIFFGLSVIAILIAAAAVWAGYYYRGKIVPVVTEQLNSRLKTPVHTDTIRVTFLKHFPKASVEFENITVMGSDPSRPGDTLIRAERLYLSFNLIDLYYGRFILSRIEAQNGFVNMNINREGVSNFEFWEPDTASASREFQIALKEVKLDDIRFQLHHEARNDVYDFDFHSLTGKGDFSSGESSSAVYGSFTNNNLQFGPNRYLTGEKLRIDAGLEMNPSIDYYQISRGIVTLRDAYKFDVKGKNTGELFSWRFSGENLEIGVLAALIPENITTFFNDFKGRGNLQFNAAFKRGENQNQPDFSCLFTLQNGSLNLPEKHLNIKHLYSSGNYKQDGGGDRLTIDSLRCSLNGEPIEGRISLKELKKPSFQLYFQHANTLSAYKHYLKADTLEPLTGNFSTEGYVSGKLSQTDSFTLSDFIGLKKQINLSFSDVKTRIKNTPYDFKDANGKVRLVGTDLFVDSLQTLLRGEHVELYGTWRNALRFIGGSEPNFRFFGNASARHVRLEELFPPGDSLDPFELPDNLIVDIHKLEVNQFEYDNIEARRVTAKLAIRPGKLNFTDLNASLLGGTADGDLLITDAPAKVHSRARLENIDITRLFTAFDNFGSEELTAQHLKGALFADLDLKLPLDQFGNPVYNESESVADIEIKDGELIDYKPLQQSTSVIRESKILNLLIKIDDFEKRLEHVKFKNLTNTVKMKDGTFFLPPMKIHSSALDIEIGGKQALEGEIDYSLNFNIKEVLQKNKVNHTEYGYIKDDGTGNKMIYLRITGTTENPIFTLDKERSQAHRKEEMKKEIKNTKSMLREEFGLFKSDTTLPNPDELDRYDPDPEFEFDPEAGYGDEGKTGSDREQKEPEKKEEKGFFRKLKEKIGVNDSARSKFDDWDFEDDDF